jgi:TonB-linked SusC/RagA family outer membrane protein
MIVSSAAVMAQNSKTIKGQVVDEKNEALIGATVKIKGLETNGTITNASGQFSINVSNENKVLVISYIGFLSQEINLAGKTTVKVVMKDNSNQIGEVVVVGFGQQTKASVVGAITQVKGEVLERQGGVSSLGAALTGNLPGVITMSTSGMPGAEDPKIVIRGSSTWNNSDPLVLVDGVEREMAGVDINSVQSISVLKDASATAVYGVKGANGVILITTKRGLEGKARIDVNASTAIKTVSKLPNKYDSYDALTYKNIALENELAVSPGSWSKMTPQDIVRKYRYPANLTEAERYPNVDWQNELFNQSAMSYNLSLNVSGGSSIVKYFANVDFVHEGDLMKVWDNGRNYKTGYGYDRLNFRSNLDFKLTSTTNLKVNLYGSGAFRSSTQNGNTGNDWYLTQQWAGAYNVAPNVFLPRYSDGTWGYFPNVSNVTNSANYTTMGGTNTQITTRITTDFVLDQNLDFITKGLSVRGSLSLDNTFLDSGRGINDSFNNSLFKWIDPATGVAIYQNQYDASNKFDYKTAVLWGTQGGTVQNGSTYRQTNLQVQGNWNRNFGAHNVTAMGVFTRQEQATGSTIPSYRENWVFRTTYNYANKYFFEYNGAYNGSEKYAAKNRFAFFNSGALGWMISEEKFMKPLTFLDMLKLRASYGEIGDDGSVGRYQYMSNWSYGGNTRIDLTNGNSPYAWYVESSVGNPEIHWEVVRKTNIAADFSFFKGLISGSLDFFQDNRRDIMVAGTSRAVPPYFGQSAVPSNIGISRTDGYELELRANKVFQNGLRLYGNLNISHAKNTIIVKDDPKLYPAYRKEAGYSIGQNRSIINSGYVNNYDQVYGNAPHDKNDSQKLPGDYYLVDFNGDGVIDTQDVVPYGFPNTPLNTYSTTLGFEYKDFSVMLQFYGVNDVLREVTLNNFWSQLDVVYNQGTWWSKNNTTADVTPSRFLSTPSYADGTRYLYDGSYLRLRNAEIAYTFNGRSIKKLGINSLRVYVNGNNLWVWSKMPDDRESNFGGGGGGGAYPTVKRFNLGLRLSL